MPIITVNVPLSTFNEVMALVSAQRYASPEQFLEIAAYNQLALERGTHVGDLVTRLTASAGAQLQAAKPKPSGVAPKKVSRSLPKQHEIPAASPADLRAVAERFSIASLEKSRLPPAASPEVIDERIWGQVNRYLPMKVATRWIAIEASRTSTWPSVTTVLSSLPGDASAFGDRTRKADTDAGRAREEMLSIGLPQHADSADRFITQIVGRLTRADRFHPGAIFQYQLAAIQDSTIALTNAGVNFACLRNPVVDDEHSSESLSAEERDFLVSHIFGTVTSEARDFTAVLIAIREGHAGPESLIAASRNFLPESWTDLARRTHIFGLLARMGKLGLIGKNWEGRRVSYVATQTPVAVAK